MSNRSGPAGLRVVVNPEGVRSAASAAAMVRAAEVVLKHAKVKHALVSITLTSARGITALNKRHFRRARATDVISFGFRDPAGALIADVYISPPVAKKFAAANGIPSREEELRLVVHGTLHALGHDHPESEARLRSPMWRLQERLLKKVLA